MVTNEEVALVFTKDFTWSVQQNGPDLITNDSDLQFKWTDAGGVTQTSTRVVVHDGGWARTQWGTMEAAFAQSAGVQAFNVYSDGIADPGVRRLTVVEQDTSPVTRTGPL